MNFFDTNIFIYAHDESDSTKFEAARDLIRKNVKSRQAIISGQVIQEFCSACLTKAQVPLSVSDVQRIVTTLLLPLLSHYTDTEFYNRTLTMFDRYSLNYYDAAIVQAAIDSGCNVVYSEDMQHGAIYGSVTVINPFCN